MSTDKKVPSKLRAVKYALLHQAASLPGVLNAEKTLNDTKCKGVKMMWDPSQGLIVMKEGRVGIVPSANVAAVELCMESVE